MRAIFSLVALFASSVVAAPPPLNNDPSSGQCAQMNQLYCPQDSPKPGNETHICKDRRLGLVDLPKGHIFKWLFTSYDRRRFGGQCPSQFIAKYWNFTSQTWAYPELNGFMIDINKKPILGIVALEPGFLLDRFGSPNGSYLAAANTLYKQRALPPDTLNYGIENYHVYNVTQTIQVEAGPAAPWFGQPGNGVQYHLLNATVAGLIGKSLVEVDLTDPHVAELFKRERVIQAECHRSTYF